MNPRIGRVGARAARNIRALRTAKGLPQNDIGMVIGVNRSAVSEIENGNRALVVDEASQIANVLGVSVQELLFDDLTTKAIRARAARLRAQADELEAGL